MNCSPSSLKEGSRVSPREKVGEVCLSLLILPVYTCRQPPGSLLGVSPRCCRMQTFWSLCPQYVSGSYMTSLWPFLGRQGPTGHQRQQPLQGSTGAPIRTSRDRWTVGCFSQWRGQLLGRSQGTPGLSPWHRGERTGIFCFLRVQEALSLLL